MELAVTRRLAGPRVAGIGPWALLGFGIGIGAGFFLGELYGADGGRRAGRAIAGAWKGMRHRPASRSSVAARVLAVLAADPALAGQHFELIPVGAFGFQLRGWVATRSQRTLAYRLATAAVDGDPIVNRLLVRGEDDIGPTLSLDDAPRSA